MLTKPTATTMGIEDRLDPEGSIKGGAAYLAYIMNRLPDSIADDDRIWFTLAAYNMGLWAYAGRAKTHTKTGW
ncbi:Membrane-bound lytic murein transglycosylase F precursor [Providencia alcalifaciens]|nr:Membrane-bound lytic murein transglycosylase F precursor [Providencia alcalifaciens]